MDGHREVGHREVQMEGFSLNGDKAVKEGHSGSPCGQSKTLTTPVGLPRPPLGCRVGVLGTELGSDLIRRHSNYSEWSGSNCRTRLQKGLWRSEGRRQGRERTVYKTRGDFILGGGRRKGNKCVIQPLRQPPDPSLPLPTSKDWSFPCL